MADLPPLINIPLMYPVIPTTPVSGKISILDIEKVFGPINDLNDFHGKFYYQGSYPFARMQFSTSGTLSLSDFYNKCSSDPAPAGTFSDYSPGSKAIAIPVFRNNFIIEIWGGGGGGSGGNHDYYPAAGNAGGTTLLSLYRVDGPYQASVGGGGGGTGGYRYGNQNGSGGGGGGYNQSGSTGGASIYGLNGSNGQDGNANDGHGGTGAGAPNGGGGGNYAGPGNDKGGNGSPAGGGGGGGGYSDFQSGKNANPNRSAGGGGGSGGYMNISIPRNLITPGQFILYTVGTSGIGLSQDGGNAQGQGGDGGPGGFRITWS